MLQGADSLVRNPHLQTLWLAQPSPQHPSAHHRKCSKTLRKRKRTWSLSRRPYCAEACVITRCAALLCCLFTVLFLPFSVVSLPEVACPPKSSLSPHFPSSQRPNVWRKDASTAKYSMSVLEKNLLSTLMRSFVTNYYDWCSGAFINAAGTSASKILKNGLYSSAVTCLNLNRMSNFWNLPERRMWTISSPLRHSKYLSCLWI